MRGCSVIGQVRGVQIGFQIGAAIDQRIDLRLNCGDVAQECVFVGAVVVVDQRAVGVGAGKGPFPSADDTTGDDVGHGHPIVDPLAGCARGGVGRNQLGQGELQVVVVLQRR